MDSVKNILFPSKNTRPVDCRIEILTYKLQKFKKHDLGGNNNLEVKDL